MISQWILPGNAAALFTFVGTERLHLRNSVARVASFMSKYEKSALLELGCAFTMELERTTNIRIIRIFKYYTVYPCILEFEYEAKIMNITM